MKKIAFVFIFLFCHTANSAEKNHTAFQGDVLRIIAPQTADHLQVEAFGHNWPIYKHEGKQVAWIGIHLNTPPKKYTLTWKSPAQTWNEHITVKKGKFRISHIQVKESMATFDAKTLKRIRADQQAILKSFKTPVNIKVEWPEMILPTEGIISTPFAAQRYVNDKPRSPHSGIDIAAIVGSPVQAPLAGTVLLVSDMYLNGTLVAIGHGDGLTTIYAHLKRSLVKVGQQLKQGEVFAEVGSSGRSTGPHLHWGVHFADAKVDPRSMLSDRYQQTLIND